MEFDEVLSHFKVKARYPNKAQAICPCHNDQTASLTISKGNKCILLHCHAGCSFESILDAAGLQKSDLFFDERKPAGRDSSLPARGRRGNGNGRHKQHPGPDRQCIGGNVRIRDDRSGERAAEGS